MKNDRPFLEILSEIKKEASHSEIMEVRRIVQLFSGRGVASLIIIFSLPFCFPIQIPGFSMPFGFLLGFIGLRMAFGRRPWWSEWILNKQITGKNVVSIVDKTVWAVRWIQKFSRPRLLAVSTSELFHKFTGILIFLLAVLLALPLPIPFTNLMTAIPILLIGFGLLEEDGLLLLIAYFLSMLTFGAFAALYMIGKAQLSLIL